MHIQRFYLYICSYADSYFADVVAVDIIQARALFEEWLWERYRIGEVARSLTTIQREVRTRNLYGYA
jgi:hypothetical protein